MHMILFFLTDITHYLFQHQARKHSVILNSVVKKIKVIFETLNLGSNTFNSFKAYISATVGSVTCIYDILMAVTGTNCIKGAVCNFLRTLVPVRGITSLMETLRSLHDRSS